MLHEGIEAEGYQFYTKNDSHVKLVHKTWQPIIVHSSGLGVHINADILKVAHIYCTPF